MSHLLLRAALIFFPFLLPRLLTLTILFANRSACQLTHPVITLIALMAFSCAGHVRKPSERFHRQILRSLPAENNHSHLNWTLRGHKSDTCFAELWPRSLPTEENFASHATQRSHHQVQQHTHTGCNGHTVQMEDSAAGIRRCGRALIRWPTGDMPTVCNWFRPARSIHKL